LFKNEEACIRVFLGIGFAALEGIELTKTILVQDINIPQSYLSCLVQRK
jgi:hypothetical protein